VSEDRRLTPRVQQVVEEVLRCAAASFTGTLVFDFKEGVPTGVKRTEMRRFAHPPTPAAVLLVARTLDTRNPKP
jgi:hypothetical protein